MVFFQNWCFNPKPDGYVKIFNSLAIVEGSELSEECECTDCLVSEQLPAWEEPGQGVGAILT